MAAATAVEPAVQGEPREGGGIRISNHDRRSQTDTRQHRGSPRGTSACAGGVMERRGDKKIKRRTEARTSTNEPKDPPRRWFGDPDCKSQRVVFVVWWVEHRKAGRASASKIAWPRWNDTRTRQEDTETGAYQWSRCAGRQPARGRGSRTSPPGGWNGRFPGEKCRWSPASRSDRPIAEAKQGQWPTSAGVGSGTTARYRASSRYSVFVMGSAHIAAN